MERFFSEPIRTKFGHGPLVIGLPDYLWIDLTALVSVLICFKNEKYFGDDS